MSDCQSFVSCIALNVASARVQEFLDDGSRQNGHGLLAPMPFGGQSNGNFGMLPMANGYPENSGVAFGGMGMQGSLPTTMPGSMPTSNELWGMRKQSFESGGNTMSLPLGMGIGGDPSMGA